MSDIQQRRPHRHGSVTPFLTGLKNPVPVLLNSDRTLFVGDWTTATVYIISTLFNSVRPRLAGCRMTMGDRDLRTAKSGGSLRCIRR